MATDERQSERSDVAVIPPPRLPYHPGIQQRFGIDQSGWRVLVESTFPAARTTEAVVLALAYCKARGLDPFKRVVHIVPVWDSKRDCEVETVWPGIAELRTTAARTGEYAGRDRTEFGPTIRKSFTFTPRNGPSEQIVTEFPEWAQVTLWRVIKGQRCQFVGPQVYWLEAYSTKNRWTDAPNAMWAKRPRGQLEKCAEAAALRSAFPEEIGSDYAAEEIEGGAFDFHGRPAIAITKQQPATTLEDLTVAKPQPEASASRTSTSTSEHQATDEPPGEAKQKRAAKPKAKAAATTPAPAEPVGESATPAQEEPPHADGPGFTEYQQKAIDEYAARVAGIDSVAAMRAEWAKVRASFHPQAVEEKLLEIHSARLAEIGAKG